MRIHVRLQYFDANCVNCFIVKTVWMTTWKWIIVPLTLNVMKKSKKKLKIKSFNHLETIYTVIIITIPTPAYRA